MPSPPSDLGNHTGGTSGQDPVVDLRKVRRISNDATKVAAGHSDGLKGRDHRLELLAIPQHHALVDGPSVDDNAAADRT